jgi:hypothetical protein
VSDVVDQHTRSLLMRTNAAFRVRGHRYVRPWGVVIDLVLMIVIGTTIDVYLAVEKGVELEERDDPGSKHDGRPGWLTRCKARC